MFSLKPPIDQFLEKAISYQQFSLNPSLIDDPNLVVKLGTKYVPLHLTWSWKEGKKEKTENIFYSEREGGDLFFIKLEIHLKLLETDYLPF